MYSSTDVHWGMGETLCLLGVALALRARRRDKHPASLPKSGPELITGLKAILGRWQRRKAKCGVVSWCYRHSCLDLLTFLITVLGWVSALHRCGSCLREGHLVRACMLSGAAGMHAH